MVVVFERRNKTKMKNNKNPLNIIWDVKNNFYIDILLKLGMRTLFNHKEPSIAYYVKNNFVSKWI